MKWFNYVFFAVCISIANSVPFELPFTLPLMGNLSILDTLPPLPDNGLEYNFQFPTAINLEGTPPTPAQAAQGQDKSITVTDINQAGFMAALQLRPGRQWVGYNAVFVAASWVFTANGVVATYSKGGQRKKNLVVVSHTLHPCCDRHEIIHRIKKIVFSPDYFVAFLKTSGENHPFVTPVKPSWVQSTTEPMKLFYFDTYQEKLLSNINVNMIDEGVCQALQGPSVVCIPPVPLESAWYTSGAVLINSNNELVGTLFAAYGTVGWPEFFVKASIFYDLLGEVLTDE